MEAIRLTTTDGVKVFVALEEVSHFEAVKKGMVVHYDNGETLRVTETFPILDYIFENYIFEINGTDKVLTVL